MARVCLVRPGEGVRLSKATVLTPTLPLGVAYVAGSARAAGHKVSVVDAVGEASQTVWAYQSIHVMGLRNEEVADRIPADAEVIGVGNMFSHNWPHVRDLIKLIRERRPEAKIVVGGEHASALPELVLESSPADACVIGEGEEIFVDLVAAFERNAPLEGVAGVAHRGADGKAVRNPRRDRIRAVDDIPWPAWDLFNVKAYAENNLVSGLQHKSAPPFMPMLATRGCPYQCTFCTSPTMWGTAWTPRDPKLVADEIEHYIRTYNARNFRFQDLTAVIRKDWIIKFCQEVIDRKLDFVWQMPSGTRSEAIDAEVAGYLKRAGLYIMAYAPESGSDRIREVIKKRIKAHNLYASAKAALDAGLHVQMFFVMGFPEEKVSDLWKTLWMIVRMAWMGVGDVAIQHYMPYPGTDMYDRLVKDGRVDTSDRWLLAPLHTHEFFIRDGRRANRNFSRYTQSFFYTAGFVLYFGLSFMRNPMLYLRMAKGLFAGSGDDVNYLQRVLRKAFFRKARPAAGPASPAP